MTTKFITQRGSRGIPVRKKKQNKAIVLGMQKLHDNAGQTEIHGIPTCGFFFYTLKRT